MSVTVTGRYPVLRRKPTGLFSLDWALRSNGKYGAPLRSIYEVYGYPNSGKSTLSYYLSGKLSPLPEITICDFENLDMDYIKSSTEAAGFDGEAKVVDVTDEKDEIRTHEQMLMDMVSNLEYSSGSVILDSVGGIQPIAEQSGDFGEAFMGKRAKLVAQVSRALSGCLRISKEDKTAFVINHVHQIMGGRGHKTAGGDVLTYMAAVRMMIWTAETFTVSDDDATPIGFLSNGKIEKLRFGARGGSFSYYIVPGYGVHPGVSAMFDCFDVGLAERGATVKMDGKSFGYLKKDLLAYASSGKERKFDPFVEALTKYQEENMRFIEEGKEEAVDGTVQKRSTKKAGKVEE